MEKNMIQKGGPIMSNTSHPAIAKPPFFTPGVIIVSIMALIGLTGIGARFLFGLGHVTNLSNQFPWGLWIGVDVACGVALAAGGFTSAFIAEILMKDDFHDIVRPALLTAMLGYTFVGLGVFVDIGRSYNIWHMLLPSMWSPNSALFEVGMCVSCYLTVLYIEFLPIALERFKDRVPWPAVNGILHFLDRIMKKVIWVFIILGVMLSCMHQSSLGALNVIAATKIHPLWWTPILPMLFLLSAFCVGPCMVIFESGISMRSFKIPYHYESPTLAKLGKFLPFLLTVYFTAKLVDMLNRESWVYLVDGSFEGKMFMLEITIGIILPFCIFISERLRNSFGWLWLAGAMVVAGVVLNRVNVFIIGVSSPYQEMTGRYSPTGWEWCVTIGCICILTLIARLIILNFPVIHALEGGHDHE